MGNLNYIVFGGVDSRDYGIYISGEGVFNAPERDVEVVNIPGKDGDLLIDRGRFLNIQVTYPGFNFEPDLSTFAERLRAFRAALASQVGYQRLEDSFHPDEFRLASFRNGLDIKPVMYNTASTFDIDFDCKPQRFLKSGEEEITIGEWGETETVSGSIATFDAESNTAIKSLVVDIEPIQSGTGEPSPSNVRPISGWDSIKAYTSGENLLWNMQANTYTTNGITYTKTADGKVVANGTATANAWYKLTNGEFICKAPMVLSGCPSGGGASTYEIQLDGVSNVRDFGSGVSFNTSGSGRFYIVVRSGQTVSNLVFEPMVRLATESAEYEPYQGETITKSLGRTVYGGTLDLISGVLTVTHGFRTYNGSENWMADGTARYTIGVSDAYRNGYTRIEVLSNEGLFSSSGSTVGTIFMSNKQLYYYPPTSVTSLADFKTWLASNPLQVRYILESPLTYQLTPEQIETILGVNNIWADSGEVSVEFGADPNILVNPTPFEALPLIEVVGTGLLTIGNITVTITGESAQDIFIDSDIMEAYEDDNGAIISRNDRISLSGMNFPTLGTDTGITYTGLTSVTVTPRWWTI